MKIEDYLHLYFGQKFQYLWNGEKSEVTLTYSFLEPEYLKHATEKRLILRPLSDMTKMEQKEYANMAGPASKGENLLPVIPAGRLINHFVNKHDPFIIKWFLSKGFDVFGLLESGLAIDAKTINK